MNPSNHGLWSYPFWIAHRGAGKLAPENTLAAFQTGASHGYRAFECDVKLSADGVPFLLHDDTLDRTTSGWGDACRHDWQALSRLDAGAWHSAAFRGEPLLCLNQLAAFCQPNGYVLNLEIKPSLGHEIATGHVVGQEVARLWAGRSDLPLLSSFRSDSLRAASVSAPLVPRALLLECPRDEWLNEAQSLGCVAVVLAHDWATDSVISQIHSAGLRALAYTVNTRETAMQLIDWGIDGLITDAIAQLNPDSGTVYANKNDLR